jgi:hypothetical protein
MVKKGAKMSYHKSGVRKKSKSEHIESPSAISEAEYLDHAYALREVHKRTDDLFGPAEYLLRNCVKTKIDDSLTLGVQDCEFLIWRFIQRLLSLEQYKAAAIVSWGPDLFTPEPHCTQLVWESLRTHAKNLIQGGGSLSKSYSGAVFFGLDYMRDPEWTCVKVLSVTRQHAVTNVFAHLKNLLQSTIVPIPNLILKSDSIRVNNDDKQGIHLTSIPQGDDGKGRLRGFHPVPRPEEHPQFGKLSRISLILDEAEEIPEGVWEDVNNILLTEESQGDRVKVFAATNPKDRNSKFGILAEPKNGWSSIDIDEHETWTSAKGWNVVRLDGARCENVEQKKIVFPGLQTWEGFERLLKLGTDNPEYFTMARGWFPESSAQVVIVNEQLFSNSKGLYTFSGPTVAAAGVDMAFDGNDSVIYTLLRHGSAIGWTDIRGEFHKFKTERRVIQVEQQFVLGKCDTIEQSKAIMKLSNELFVKPQWLSTDRTGNGTGVHDALCSMFGPEVFGIMFGWAATDTRILDDDSHQCSEIYHDIVTEMAFAVRRFMETDLIKLNPGISWNQLEKETVPRRYSQQGRGILRIESKKDFKKRNSNNSPDRFDSLIIAVHGVRMNAGMSGLMVENPAQTKQPAHKQQHGVVDVLEFLDMST